MDDLVVKGGGLWRVPLLRLVQGPAVLRANAFIVSIVFHTNEPSGFGAGFGYWMRPWTSVTEVRFSHAGTHVMLTDDEGTRSTFVRVRNAKAVMAQVEEHARSHGIPVTRGGVFRPMILG
jgi:hypothetical protein